MRGFLVRKAQATQKARMRLAERYVVKFQARSRAALTRREVHEERKQQMNLLPWVVAIQSQA